MKRVQVLISFLVGIFIGFVIWGIPHTTNTINSNSIGMEKKLSCQKLQVELTTELNKHYSNLKYYTVELDKIFYSPIRDSCLYSYRAWSAPLDPPTFYLQDALTNEVLFQATTLPKSKDFEKSMNEFSNVVAKYENIDSTKEEIIELGQMTVN